MSDPAHAGWLRGLPSSLNSEFFQDCFQLNPFWTKLLNVFSLRNELHTFNIVVIGQHFVLRFTHQRWQIVQVIRFNRTLVRHTLRSQCAYSQQTCPQNTRKYRCNLGVASHVRPPIAEQPEYFELARKMLPDPGQLERGLAYRLPPQLQHHGSHPR